MSNGNDTLIPKRITTETWLKYGELCLLTLTVRAILEEIVRKGLSRRMWETYPGKEEYDSFLGKIIISPDGLYYLRIVDPKNTLGNSYEELHRVDNAQAHELMGDQALRYLRFLDYIYNLGGAS